MNLCDCPRCGRRELRGLRALHSVPTSHGDVLAMTCRRCGAEVSRRHLPPRAIRPLDLIA